jgi:tetratricopeptide (TPR) repeat protein
MKSRFYVGVLVCAGLFVCVESSAMPSYGQVSRSTNRIEGIVFDPGHRPVPDLYVELQNEYYSTISRSRTDSTGRFTFIGYPAGHYNVRVLTTATNYAEHTEGVDIVNPVRGGSDAQYLDIVLKVDKRKVRPGIATITGSVFAQDVPEEARRLYKQGLRDINEPDGKGFTEIDAALKIFPTYYDALDTMGREYVARSEYQKSLPYLIKSIDVNQRSFSSFYALAYACYQLNHRQEALQAAHAAVVLQANSANAQLLYGTLLRLDSHYPESEKALREAEKLTKDSPVAEVHWQLALLYNHIGRNKDAADELEMYLKLEPDAAKKKEIQDLIAKLRKDANIKSHFGAE